MKSLDRQKLTRSEDVFSKYCSLRGYSMHRIIAGRTREKSPDWEVTAVGTRVVVEVKELQANPNDIRFAEDMRMNQVGSYGDKLGRRVSLHIMDAAKQLCRYQTEDAPCVIVLFDNVVVGGFRQGQEWFAPGRRPALRFRGWKWREQF